MTSQNNNSSDTRHPIDNIDDTDRESDRDSDPTVTEDDSDDGNQGVNETTTSQLLSRTPSSPPPTSSFAFESLFEMSVPQSGTGMPLWWSHTARCGFHPMKPPLLLSPAPGCRPAGSPPFAYPTFPSARTVTGVLQILEAAIAIVDDALQHMDDHDVSGTLGGNDPPGGRQHHHHHRHHRRRRDY